MGFKLSEFAKTTNGPAATTARPPLTDPRFPGIVFPTPSSVPGGDAPDGVLAATSRIRTLADPLVANLKTPLLALVSLCESAWRLRVAAADSYVEKFDASRPGLIAGADEAKSQVNVFGGEPLGPRQEAAQARYLDRMRTLLLSQVNEELGPKSAELAGQIVNAVQALDRALDGAEIDRAIPSLAKSRSADDEAHITSIRRDLERLPFSDMEALYAKAAKIGDPKRLDDLEAAIVPILDAFITASPIDRAWRLKGGDGQADLREGEITKMLGVARSLRTAMLRVRDAREPQDYDLAVGLAMELRRVFEKVLGLSLGQLPPAEFSAMVDGGKYPASSWEIAPGWLTRDMPGTPPEGWTRLSGWEKLGASRKREQWTAGAAASDPFSGLLQRST